MGSGIGDLEMLQILKDYIVNVGLQGMMYGIY